MNCVEQLIKIKECKEFIREKQTFSVEDYYKIINFIKIVKRVIIKLIL
ncbi:hypothetical protein HMPREF0216_00391 [Clostridium celatum DSM 1785]|uniref:Uncharacterized protein n=1 Tax=Clostridium celatum DSM 1785 TaxID=545697 RepID=L1QN86_9CLOT|nr:hypothetical protein HMPREF0216_00391 [Clostridium celatum DSM 1785]